MSCQSKRLRLKASHTYLQDDEYEMLTVFNGQIDRLCRIKALKELTRRLEADEIEIGYL